MPGQDQTFSWDTAGLPQRFLQMLCSGCRGTRTLFPCVFQGPVGRGEEPVRSGGQAAPRAGASRQRQRRQRGKHRSEGELQAAESWNDKSSQVLTRSLCPGPLAQLSASQPGQPCRA